jgi:uncharacterized protein YraI
MRNQLWTATIALSFAMSSCNMLASQTTETPASTPTSMLDTPIASIPITAPTSTATPLGIELPTITSTSTSSVFLASPKDQPVNCRFGPGTSYAVIGALIVGRQAEIIGRNQDSTWWYVRNPSDPSTSCWLSTEFVQTVGNVHSLPVVSPPDIMVTSINVRVDPPTLNVACDAFPQVVTISADITSTGPASVVWHWELSTGAVSPDKNLLFEEGATKTVQDYYQVDGVNDYLIKVMTTLPNIMIGQYTFRVVCTP